MNERKRDKWECGIQSLFAQVGYCIGIGNVWRFPYICQKNGGGVFLIPYALSLVVMAIPLYIFEVGLGQVTNSGRLAAWNRLPLMKGLGYASLVITVFAMIPYMLVMAWSILYLGHSMTTDLLPWTTCDNPWNTNSCVTLELVRNTSLTTFLSTSNQSLAFAYSKESLSQVQFWRNYVARIPNTSNALDGEFNWPMLCALIAAVTTVFFVNIRGIKTSGKVVYFTATFPYVSLIALLIRGATLDGASMGIRAYLLPDLSQLAKAQVWVDAASQAVYSYGIGFVALTAMGGYNNYTDNFYRSSFFIAAIGTVTSFTMGFATFSVLGHLSHVMGVNINDVVQSGPGLVFQVLPVALGLLPASQVWSALFFLMIYFVAIDSAFAEFEGLVTILGDAVPGLISTPLRRVATNTVLGFVYFLVCSSQLSKQGIYIFELIFFYGASGISLIFIVLVETIAVGWLWDAAQFKRDVKQMTGSDLSRFFIYCYKYVTPLVSLFLLIFFIIKFEPLTVGDFVYPVWATVIGWGMALCSILCFPAVMIYVILKGKGTLRERFQRGLRPIAVKKLPEDDEAKLKITEVLLEKRNTSRF